VNIGLISGLDVKSFFRGNLGALAVRGAFLTIGGGLTGGLDLLYFKQVLGADAVLLGLFTSVWSSVFLIFVLVGGWVSDRYDRKKAYLLGSVLSLPNPLIYALTPSWHLLFLSNFLGAVSSAIVTPAYISILFSSVKQNNRSSAIATINTLSFMLNIVVPPLSASTIQWMGGLPSIRVMFFFQFAVTLGVWLYTSRALQVQAVNEKREYQGLQVAVKDIFSQMRKVYSLSREKKATPWLYVYLTSPLAWEMVSPFWTIYAAEVCESPIYVIGLLTTAGSLTILFLQLPLARVSDTRGRRRVILLVHPFRYLCFLTLILAGTFRTLPFIPFIPLLAWVLDAVGNSANPSWTAASSEVVPVGLQGTWNSLLNFLYYLAAIPAGLIGGLLWNIDPRLPFTMAFVVAVLRYSLLLRKIPETVHP